MIAIDREKLKSALEFEIYAAIINLPRKDQEEVYNRIINVFEKYLKGATNEQKD